MRRLIVAMAWGSALVALAVVLVSINASQIRADSSTDYGWLKEEVLQITTTTAGGLGAATGTGDTGTPIRGHIYALNLDFAVGLPAATDVTLTGTSPDLTILTLTNVMTDGWYYPTVTQTMSTGVALAAYDRLPMNSKLHVAMAQTYPVTGANTLTVTVLWGE